MANKYARDVLTLTKVIETLKTERQVWETNWQELANYMLPRKNDIQITTTPGQKKGTNILDSTGMDSVETLGGALHSLLTNPNDAWFEMTSGDDDLDKVDAVRLWFQDTANKMNAALNNSNFQTEVHEMYLDEVTFGTAGLSCEEDPDSDVVFASRPIQEIYLEEDNKGRVNGVIRLFKWSAQQCAMEFGADNLTPKIAKAYEKNQPDLFEIAHAVYQPQENYKGKEVDSIFKFVSQYVSIADKEVLRQSGFYELSIITPRWTKVSGEKYGRSPAMKALPEVKTLNVMMDTTIRAAQKMVDPPLQAPDDGFVLGISTKPAAINYYRAGSNEKIEPIYNNAQVDFGFHLIEGKQKMIRSCFYVDQLKLQQQGPQMTATEVLQRTEESMRLLGPILGRMQSEFLRPLIARVYAIMNRKKRFKPLPVELRGKAFDVRYSSMIARTQRVAKGQNIVRTLQASEGFINADPTIMDNFNGDRTVRFLAGVYGYPQDCMSTTDEMKATRQQRAQGQQQAVDQQNQQAQVDQASKMMPAMAQLQNAQNKG